MCAVDKKVLEELTFLTSQLDVEEAHTLQSHIQFLVLIKQKISFLKKQRLLRLWETGFVALCE
jgi:hypothetical protein